MRKPRDYDAELKALADKAKALRERKVTQLGELVIATKADTLDVEVLAGALLAAVGDKDNAAREAWRKAGAAFFSGGRSARRKARPDSEARAQGSGDAQPGAGGPRAS
jgi:hypothetical protein